MSDQPDLPALSDDELRETLDRLASLALNLSDQVEDQTKAINRATTAANEARRAAVTVQSQNDPAGFGDRIGQAVEARLLDTLQRLDRTVNHLDLRTNKTAAVLDQASEDRGNLLRNIRDREERLDRWKSYWPWFGLGALVLALAMTVALPRFLASTPSTCAVLGATWTATTEGVNACVFYQR